LSDARAGVGADSAKEKKNICKKILSKRKTKTFLVVG
jgi:hypothetical protein